MAECSNSQNSPAVEPENVEVLPSSFNGLGDNSTITNGGLRVPVLHVEILQQNNSTLLSDNLMPLARKALKDVPALTEDLLLTDFKDPDVKKHIQHISISDVFDAHCEGKSISLNDAKLIYHIFRLNTDPSDAEGIKTDDVSAAIHWVLPAADLDGLWNSLVYDSDIKMQLLNFVSTTLLFSEKNVDSNIISWNRVVLLHGPPGTGKTSLCKALAHKISIRLSDKYNFSELIEINSHSLFSKWFSESGKLVMKMFQKIEEIISDPETLVFVMIDEIESLAHARKASLGGAEPSDAIRVVNALLTQLDQIKRYPNVIILTTSNITEAIDIALVDRADIKHYVGLPSVAAIYQIYYSCIKELQRANIICTKETIFPLRQLDVSHVYGSGIQRHSLRLREIAKQSVGLSGRTLRKLPFLAHAFFIQSSFVSLDDFLECLSKAAIRQFEERENLKRDH